MKKTTMSVREMGTSLGLKKVESYWLVHKNYFETIKVNGKMRVVIKSFEVWYNSQIHYQKVDGPPPDVPFMSVRQVGMILGLRGGTAYDLVRKGYFHSYKHNGRICVDRKSFDEWMASQHKYKPGGGLPPKPKRLSTGYADEAKRGMESALRARFEAVIKERSEGG